MRNLFSSRSRSLPRRSRAARARSINPEALADPHLLATLSIGDATMKEQGNLTTFVARDTNRLVHPADLAFGPDRDGDSIDDLFVVGRVSDNVNVYDGKTGAYVEQFVGPGSGLDGAAWMKFGPDKSLYISTVSSTGSRDTVLRIDQSKVVTTFIANTNPEGNGGLSGARGMAFGLDGNTYIASTATDQVLRYNGGTGAFIDALVPAGGGGLDGPNGVLFGNDRNGDAVSDLYVSSGPTDQVLVYSARRSKGHGLQSQRPPAGGGDRRREDPDLEPGTGRTHLRTPAASGPCDLIGVRRRGPSPRRIERLFHPHSALEGGGRPASHGSAWSAADPSDRVCTFRASGRHVGAGRECEPLGRRDEETETGPSHR